ncbi:hypothetical protein LCGC14_0503990 [marine sediment metagenome]|uniref:Uncharacterized protein n=1 Tax=marine sediment metagenome TaxID=412755 RepID=A0A0F9S833_9ZZZZ
MRVIIDTVKIIANQRILQRLTYNPHYTLTLYDNVSHQEKVNLNEFLPPAGKQ